MLKIPKSTSKIHFVMKADDRFINPCKKDPFWSEREGAQHIGAKRPELSRTARQGQSPVLQGEHRAE